MNLILDWGNTSLKTSVFERDNQLESAQLESISKVELDQIFSEKKIENCILSSVVNHPEWLTQFILDKNGIILTSDTPLPIQLEYKTPLTLGKDRIANVVGASRKFQNQNNLVIDIGTCLKFDFISKDSIYAGGSISPGFQMRLNALNQNTDQLPLVDKQMVEELIGASTKDSILSGVYFGIIDEIDGIINRYKKRYSQLQVIITGGDAFYFEKALKNTIFAHSFLTLYGLNEILSYNEK